jgi:CBS domain containing-hemolysin-like protein
LTFTSHEEGVIEESEREMISNVFDFQDSSAADVMIPRTEITALSADASYAETLNMFRERPFSRLPVYDGDVDDIIGILHIKDFFFGAVPDNFDARGLTRPAR